MHHQTSPKRKLQIKGWCLTFMFCFFVLATPRETNKLLWLEDEISFWGKLGLFSGAVVCMEGTCFYLWVSGMILRLDSTVPPAESTASLGPIEKWDWRDGQVSDRSRKNTSDIDHLGAQITSVKWSCNGHIEVSRKNVVYDGTFRKLHSFLRKSNVASQLADEKITCLMSCFCVPSKNFESMEKSVAHPTLPAWTAALKGWVDQTHNIRLAKVYVGKTRRMKFCSVQKKMCFS